MSPYIKVILLFSFLSPLAACNSWLKDEKSVNLDARHEQEQHLHKADRVYLEQKYPEAERLYAEFQTLYPSSVYFQKAQFGRARSLEAQEKWAEAADLYRKTTEATRSRQPEIAAQALYQLSFCYENLGDEARVLASLKDALSLKEHLTEEQVLAEIPARMAASYNRMGRTQEAEQYFRQAEQGIQKMRPAHAGDKSSTWIANTYYWMGVYSTNQLSFENLQATLDTLKMVQIFSLRSAEAGSDPWSKQAAQGLMNNYRDLWAIVQQIPLNKAMDRGAARREQVDRQMNFTGQILNLINELKIYRAPNRDEESDDAKELFRFIGQLEKQAQDFLNSLIDQTPLTPEAKKRGSVGP